MIQSFSRGDVYYCDFEKIKIIQNLGEESNSCIIISNNYKNVKDNTVVVLPIINRSKKNKNKYNNYIEINEKGDVVLCNKIITLNKSSLKQYIGKLDILTINQINDNLKNELDLTISNEVNDKLNLLFKELLELNNKYSYICSLLNNSNDIIINNINENNDINQKEKHFYKDNKYNKQHYVDFIKDYYTLSKLELSKKYNINTKSIAHKKYITIKKLKEWHIDYTQFEECKKINKKTNNKIINTKEELIILVKDFYNLSEEDFMHKYKLLDKFKRLNKKTSACATLLKKYNFDYKTLNEYKKHKKQNYSEIVNFNDVNDCIRFIDETSDKDGVTESCIKYGIKNKRIIYNIRGKCRKILETYKIYI